MDKKKNEMAVENGMKNWLLRKRFQDFCDENNVCSVLLVADNPFIEHYFKLLFKGCNCKFMSASSGRDAIIKIEKSGAPNIVLVDEDLPDMDAAELTSTIKKLWSKLKVINVQFSGAGRGKSSRVASAGFGRVGPASHIEKPFNMGSVVQKITRMIGG
jgi:CheY-like chemotaxis protein